MNQLRPFYRGDDHALKVTVREKGKESGLDITGWVFTSTLKLSSELPDEPELDDQGNRQVLKTVTTAPDDPDSRIGVFYLMFRSEGTKDLIPTNYELDVQSEHNDVVKTLFKGRIQVLSDVTHEESANE